MTSVLAILIVYLAGSLTYFAVGDPFAGPIGVSVHDNFHIVEEAGFSLMGGVLLLFLAWTSVRAGEPFGICVLVIAGIPAVMLPLLAYRVFGPWHDYVVLPLALWLPAVASAAAGLTLKRRESHRESS
jgi:hypothetical protein